MISDYIKYCIKRRGKFHLHSPLVYNFYIKILDNLPLFGWQYEIYLRLANYRKPINVIIETNNISSDRMRYIAKICNVTQLTTFIDTDGGIMKTQNDSIYDFILINGKIGKSRIKDIVRNILIHCNKTTAIMFERPYYRKTNRAMWNYLIDNKSVTLSIDCFRFGFVFFMDRPEKQHFILKV